MIGRIQYLKELAKEQNRTVVTMDNDYMRELALSDPRLFFQTYKPPILIDEIQKAPGLLEYINRYRVDQAAIMLLETSLPVTQIAQRCGYTSDASFIRVFKQYRGMTPGRFREENAA